MNRAQHVPVLYFGRNVHYTARSHLHSIFAPLLVITMTAHAYQYLTAAAFRMVNMPVISAAGFKCHIEECNLIGRQRGKVALPEKYCA